MSDIAFGYEDYLEARKGLWDLVNSGLTLQDKQFLVAFEKGEPNWADCSAGDLSDYPSVQWKLMNIAKLKESNPKKFEQGIKKLEDYLGV